MSLFEETISKLVLERVGSNCPKCGGTPLLIVWEEPKGYWRDGEFSPTDDDEGGYVALCGCGARTFICRGGVNVQ